MKVIDFDTSVFETAVLDEKIIENSFTRISIKIGTLLITIVVMIGTVSFHKFMFGGCILACIVCVGFLFWDIYLTKKNYDYKLKIYRIKLKSYEERKEYAKLKKKYLPDNMVNFGLEEPDNRVYISAPYYGIFILIDVTCAIFCAIL